MFHPRTHLAWTLVLAVVLLSGSTAWAQFGGCSSCAVGAAPYGVNRIMWTPSYGITSNCNPACPGTCTYATTAFLPVAPAYRTASFGTYTSYFAPTCNTCVPGTTTVAYTTYRPFLDWLFHPFRPRVTYATASYQPACGTACCPTGGCPTTTYLPASSACCPTGGCPTACDIGCGSACVGGCPTSSCPSGACSAATVQSPDPASQTPTLNTAPTPTYENTPQPSADTGVLSRPSSPIPVAPAAAEEPRLVPPTGPTASRPVRQAAYLLPVSVPVRTQVPAPAPLDVDGWEPVRD